MVLSRNKKNNAYPCKPQFYYIKVGFNGVKIYRYVFLMFAYIQSLMFEYKMHPSEIRHGRAPLNYSGINGLILSLIYVVQVFHKCFV